MRSRSKVLSLFAIIFLFCQCYENTEGCLDPTAGNFDVLADNPCDSCCIDPSITLSQSAIFEFDSLSYHKDSTFLDAANNMINFSSLKFVLSGFELYDDNNAIIENRSTLTHDGLTINADFVFINSSNGKGRGNILDHRYVGPLTKVCCTVGVVEAVNNSDRNFDNAVFDQVQNLMQDDTITLAYSKLKMSYFLADSIVQTLELPDIDDEQMCFDLITDIVLGQNITIKMQFDLKTWIADIDFANDVQADILVDLNTNLLSAFSIKE